MAENTSVNDAVSIGREGDIALVCIDNPPVNATGHAVRQGLEEAISSLNEDGDAKVIATGGLAPLFAGSATVIDKVDGNLTLDGLYMIHRNNTA